MNHQSIIQSAYPQALSRIIAICGDITVAEDCLQDAVEKALNHWL